MSTQNIFILIIGSFYALIILILVLLWFAVKRIKIPLRSQRIVYVGGIFAVSLIAASVVDYWHYLYEVLGLLDKNHMILNPDGTPSTYNTKKVIDKSFSIFPILVSAYLFNSLLSFFIWEGTLVDEEGMPIVPKIIRTIVNVLVFVIAIVIIVAIHFEELLNKTLVGMGTSGAVGALVAREPLQKAFTALSLNISKWLKKGDVIQVAGITGKIHEIGWSSVKLITSEQNLASIPNTFITKNQVVNLSRPKEDLFVSVSVSAPLGHSIGRMTELLKRSAQDSDLVKVDPKIIKQFAHKPSNRVKLRYEPIVKLRHIGQHRIYYTIDVISEERRQDLVRSEVLRSAWGMMCREGILPLPVSHYVEDPIERAKTLLNQVDILEPFNDEEDEQIARGAKWLRYVAPERIVIQGEQDAALYIIAEGSLEVLVMQSDGTRLKVAELHENAIFGDMALLTGEPRSATVRAITDVLVLKISKEVISPILRNREEILEQLSKELAIKQIEIEKKSDSYNDHLANSRQRSLADRLNNQMRRFLGVDDNDNSSKKPSSSIDPTI